MTDARAEILRRIRVALRDVPPGEAAAGADIARDYDRRSGLDAEQRLQRLSQRLSDYHADVRRVAPGEIAQAVSHVCAASGLRRLAIPAALPRRWRPEGVELVQDRATAGLTAAELDLIDGALTGCAVAIAETGTLVLDGQGTSGRRLLTLVPDHHICIVKLDQVVGLVPEAIAALESSVVDRGVPVTLISGPSATSDIELERVEGVHGPRHLVVLIAG
jgi:L-lactate dehydrogenase complex protein LldG